MTKSELIEKLKKRKYELERDLEDVFQGGGLGTIQSSKIQMLKEILIEVQKLDEYEPTNKKIDIWSLPKDV